MKEIILRFTDEGEDGVYDIEEAEVFLKAKSLYFTLCNFDQWLRSEYKYKNKETINTWDARQKLHYIMEEYGINMDMLS